MYERFTDRARKVMQLANQEAQRFNHAYIGTEHILLGLVKEGSKEGSGVAARVLKNLDINLRRILLEVEKIIQPGPDVVPMGKLPQTPRAKKVIEYSIEEARSLNCNYVGTEHLLLGLVREEGGVAAQVLINLGLSLTEIRAEILQLVGMAHGKPISGRSLVVGLEPCAVGQQNPNDLASRIERAVRSLEAVSELFQEMKGQAVAGQEVDWAARLQDQSDSLLRIREFLRQERHRLDGSKPDQNCP